MSAPAYIFSNDALTPVDLRAQRPLRWAAWHPDGSWCLLVGNGGTAVRFDPSSQRLDPIDTGSKRNLRGVAFSPDGGDALLVGNQGAVLHYDGSNVRELSSPTTENLRRVAWHPDDGSALIVGNAGTVLRYASGTLAPVPGDRAHTLRAIAWRPDGQYALVGAYASRYAGYPRPHALYKCDGRYLQALLTSDHEDDFVAVDWHPDGRRALIAGYAVEGRAPRNKLLTYDGGGFSHQEVEASGSLLGAAWHPSGDYALLCGERGALLRYAPEGRVEALESGTTDNLVGPFWRPDPDGRGGSTSLLLRGPGERVYTV
jgi:WD40 repeat protein